MGIGEVLSEIREKGKRLSAQAAEQLSSHRTAVLCAAAGCGVIVILLVVLVIVRYLPPKTAGAGSGEAFAPRALSPEDLFMLPEPDFVPEVLLEREPKDGWSEEDARQFWTDPLQGNEELWKRRIESDVDAMLERIP